MTSKRFINAKKAILNLALQTFLCMTELKYNRDVKIYLQSVV